MTTADKSRVKLLDKISHMYAKTGRVTLILILGFVGILLIDFAIAAAEDNEIYVMPIFHAFMSNMILIFMPYISTSFVGDINSLYKNNGMEMAINGCMTTGNFFCTLPFRAKDIMSIRIMNTQKQIIFMSAAMLIVEIGTMIASGMGYDIYGGVNGLAFLTTIIWEVIIMLIAFSRNAIFTIVLTVLGCLVTFGSFMWIADYADAEQKDANFLDVISKFELFSGVSGIIICVAATALIIFASEKALKSKTNVSWNLSK